MGVMTRLLLLLWAGVTVGVAVDVHKRIISGVDCGSSERQYHVKLVKQNGKLICGGSLISGKWILTAAHCWEWAMHVDVGLGQAKGAHAQPGPVLITSPPVMYGDNNNKIHDMMLLTLPTDSGIVPINLPSEGDCKKHPDEDDKVEIAGYGSKTLGALKARQDDESLTLQCAEIPVVDCLNLRQCMENEPVFKAIRSYQHFFCVKSKTVDVSLGDSGGGAVIGDKIFGVISFMADRNTACASPAAFMNVCKYMTWIKTNTGIKV